MVEYLGHSPVNALVGVGKNDPVHRFLRKGSRFKVKGARFRVKGSGCKVQGKRFRVQGSGCKVQVSFRRFKRHLAALSFRAKARNLLQTRFLVACAPRNDKAKSLRASE